MMWHTVLENLIPLVFTVLTPVLLVLVHYGLRLLAKKWGLEQVLVYEDKVDELVLKGIKAAEQKSLTAVKKGGDPTPGEQKLDDVLKFVNAQLKALGLDQKAADELKMLVESKLYDEKPSQPELPAADPA
jgi:hypothetical protein